MVVWGGYDPPVPLTPEWLQGEFRARSRAYFVLAGPDDAPLALVGMRRHFRQSRVHLIRVGVAPDHRGQGLVGRVIEAVASVARLGGAERLTLNVFGSNASAIRAYEKARFKRFGTVATADDPSGVVVRMRRRL